MLKARTCWCLALCLLPLLTSLFTGCATHSQSRLLAIGVSAPLGATIGGVTAPEDEKPEFHALTWGSVFMAATAVLANFYFSGDEELAKLRQENFDLKNKPDFQLITEGEGYFQKTFTDKGKTPVKWRVYKIDRWISDGENKKYHQDMMIERIIKDEKTKKQEKQEK